MNYKHLDMFLIQDTVRRYLPMNDILDIYITGSYAYGGATEESDVDFIVSTKNEDAGLGSNNRVIWRNGLKLVFIEKHYSRVFPNIWAKKFSLPLYSILSGDFYPGNKEHIEEWKTLKKERNCGKNIERKT